MNKQRVLATFVCGLTEDGHEVVGVLVRLVVRPLGLQQRLHLLQVLALLQQRYRVVLAPASMTRISETT